MVLFPPLFILSGDSDTNGVYLFISRTYCTERQFLPEEAVIKAENEKAQISAVLLVALQSNLKLLIKVK